MGQCGCTTGASGPECLATCGWGGLPQNRDVWEGRQAERAWLPPIMWICVVNALPRPLMAGWEGEAPLECCPDLAPWPILRYAANAFAIAGSPGKLQRRCRVLDAGVAVYGAPFSAELWSNVFS